MVHRLRGFRSALAALLVAGGLYACSGGDLTGPERSESPRTEGTPSGRTPSGAPAPSPSLLPDGDLTPLRICGEETVSDLLAGRDEVVGDVTVTNDEGELSVVYRLDEGWELRATHLSVTDDVASIPATGSGNPKPGQFAETHEEDPGTTSSRFDLSLENLGAEVGDRLVVAAHADVVQPGDPSDPDDDREEGAWADGERLNDSPHGSWATYFEAEVQGCETASQRIDSDGGTITAGGVTLEIPVGALDTDTRITVEPVSLGDLDAGELDGLTDEEMDAIVAGTVVDLGPDGLTFDEPVELMLTYDEADLSDGFDEADLELATLSDTGVDPLVPSTVDTDANTVTAEVGHFTLFFLFRPTIVPFAHRVEEEITVSNSVRIRLEAPPTGVSISEEIVVADSVNIELGEPPVDLTVSEAIVVSDSVSIELSALNSPPSATITAPAGGASFTEGVSILFEGTGSDPEDGTLTGSSLVWTSDLDGELGTGTSLFISTLSIGTHTVTLTATDSNGATGTASVTITVTSSTGSGEVLFRSNATGDYQLYRMAPDGSNLTALTQEDPDSYYDGHLSASWSPDGTEVVFITPEVGPDIHKINRDGTGETNLTNSTANDFDPQWSPDGASILFWNRSDGDAEIYRMDSQGTTVQKLTDNTIPDSDPEWSPDGTQIVFTRQTTVGGDEIFVMDAGGTNMTNLTEEGAADRDPTWSPTGDKIAFRSNRAGTLSYEFAIFVMNSDGTNLQQLTPVSDRIEQMTWSPDGIRLAIESPRDGDAEIFVVAADGSGSGMVKLTDNTAEDRAPIWSPDGTQIMFTSDRSGSYDFRIYVMDVDGSNVTLISDPGGTVVTSDWQ